MMKTDYIENFSRFKRQNVTFFDCNSDLSITREIVYPFEETQKSINNYFLDSISNDALICVKSHEDCFCFSKKNDNLSVLKRKSKIDNYWIDGEVFLIDSKFSRSNSVVFVVIDCELDKEEIFYKLKEEKIMNDESFVDCLSECWIKRM